MSIIEKVQNRKCPECNKWEETLTYRMEAFQEKYIENGICLAKALVASNEWK